jgi:hypothetical protein
VRQSSQRQLAAARETQINSTSHPPYLRDPDMSITLSQRGETSLPIEIGSFTPTVWLSQAFSTARLTV